MTTPTLALVLLLFAAVSTASCQQTGEHPEPSGDTHVATVERFRAARDADDLAAARALMSADPRRWWDAKEGPGAAWTLGVGGPWAGWDEHFNGESKRMTPWTVEGDSVWADFYEINDYFRLTEREGGHWRGTYFLDTDGHISGFMVSSAPGHETPRGRGDEFRTWAFATHAEEAEYLMPDGKLDPTGDRPPRMRALLAAWRTAIGLPQM